MTAACAQPFGRTVVDALRTRRCPRNQVEQDARSERSEIPRTIRPKTLTDQPAAPPSSAETPTASHQREKPSARFRNRLRNSRAEMISDGIQIGDVDPAVEGDRIAGPYRTPAVVVAHVVQALVGQVPRSKLTAHFASRDRRPRRPTRAGAGLHRTVQRYLRVRHVPPRICRPPGARPSWGGGRADRLSTHVRRYGMRITNPAPVKKSSAASFSPTPLRATDRHGERRLAIVLRGRALRIDVGLRELARCFVCGQLA